VEPGNLHKAEVDREPVGRNLSIVLSAVLALFVLRGVNYITDLDFWWEYPRTRAFLFVLTYGAGLIATTVGCVSATVLLLGFGGRSRIAGLTAVVFCGYGLASLTMEAARDYVDRTWQVAKGNVKTVTVVYERETRQIRVSGAIDIGSAARFKQVLEDAPDARIVDVSGPGGFVYEARWIARMIEQRRIDTIVTSECHSACVDIFAAGNRRLMHAKAIVGLHSARSPSGNAATVTAANDAFSKRLYKIGVEPRFLMVGTDTPSDDIWINTARQAYVAGLATDVVGK